MENIKFWGRYHWCLFASLVLLQFNGCKKDDKKPQVEQPPQKICQVAYLGNDHGHYKDSLVYEYQQEKVSKIRYYYDKVHALDILITYSGSDELEYQVYRKSSTDQLAITGKVTLKDGLIRQVRDRSLFNWDNITYNMEYTKEGYLLRVRTGEPEGGLSDFQDFAYTDGNLTHIYDGSWQNIFTEITYSDQPMQAELVDYFIPLKVNTYDMRQLFLALYRMGLFGKRSKNMPKETISFVTGKRTLVNTYSYARDARGKVTRITKSVVNVFQPGFNYTGYTSINYLCN